jgi:hypothetical protein
MKAGDLYRAWVAYEDAKDPTVEGKVRPVVILIPPNPDEDLNNPETAFFCIYSTTKGDAYDEELRICNIPFGPGTPYQHYRIDETSCFCSCNLKYLKISDIRERVGVLRNIDFEPIKKALKEFFPDLE